MRMKRIQKIKSTMLILALSVSVVSAIPVSAEKPSWAGNNGAGEQHKEKVKHGNQAKSYNQQESYALERPLQFHFSKHQRSSIQGYYSEQFRTGHCPPGLSKKKNGCMPPGQAKKWRVGAPLPKDVIFHDLPSSLVVELGRPPAGHRYVRVASDILMIAVGTGMVIDAIEDLSGM